MTIFDKYTLRIIKERMYLYPRYFVVMVISHLALTKAARLPEKLSSQVELLLNRFLRSMNFNLFCMWMVKARRYIWVDIFPPLSLVYSPLCYTSGPNRLTVLGGCCDETPNNIE